MGFLNNRTSQMNVVMAIMLIAILLAATVFFWRTSQTFSKSFSDELDKRTYENIASYIENVVAHNEVAWIERTLIDTSIPISLKYNGEKYLGENELFKIEYVGPTNINLSTKNRVGNTVDTKNVILNTRFYVEGNYNIYSNPTSSDLRDKNIIGDFLFTNLERINLGNNSEYIAYLSPTFKPAIIGNAGEPPESLAKSCFLLEYPKSEWSIYYDSSTNPPSYHVSPTNYYILEAQNFGIDSRYIGYYTNIIVPSESLMIPYLSNYKEELNEYVQNGGSLILFSQNQNKKTRYDFLPVAITFNQGNYDTIGISKEHAITSNLFPYEVAGSFYSSMGTILEPYYDTPGAEILIRETPYGPYKNNNPSLVLSTWGAGKIIATTIPLDKKSVLDTNTTVCKWWDPDTIGQGHDWHFRRLVIIDAGNVTRVNEPVELIIDPTAEINKLAKDGLVNLENSYLDLNSIRVVELLPPDYCSNKVAIPSQSYMYRPNLEHPRYQCAPIDTLAHPLLFELDAPAKIKVVMTVPAGSYCKDRDNIRNEIRVKVNDVWVTHAIDSQRDYEINNNIPSPGYWNAQDGECGGGEGCQGPRSYEVEIPAEYFHKGDNKIVLSMEHLTGTSLTWYRNVEFSLYYYNQSTLQYVLFWKEYQPMHIYFPMGATAAYAGETPGTTNSVTPKGSKRYYEIYFDIENPTNPSLNKPVPPYRIEDNVVFLKWSKNIDKEPSFPLSISNTNSYTYPHLRNISSPTTKDVDGDGDIDIIIGLRDGNVALIDGPTGNIIWKKPFDKVQKYIGSGNGPYTVYGRSIIGSPAIADIDNDGEYEIIGGSANLIAYIESTSSKNVRISLDDTNITVLDKNGNVKWKVPVSGSVVSAPAIADVDGDGFKDIIVQTLKTTTSNNSGIRYTYSSSGASISDNNRPVTLTDVLYVISGRTHGIIWQATVSSGTYSQKYFATVDADKRIHLMFPSSSPAIGDLDGDGKPEIAMGSVDGRVYAYDHTGPPYKWRSTITANISNNFSNLLGYIVSSPTITRTNNQKNYDDVIASFVTNGGDQLQIYMLDGKNGSPTQISDITSKAAKHPAGHPIVHWPEGYHHRGPQVTIAMNNYICIEHLAQTHTVYGNITQAGAGNKTQSYATPVIVEANSYSTDLRKHETGRFDIIIGAENGHLYCHAYTDTNGEADEGNNENLIDFSNKLKRLWDYTHGSPIRSSVAVDDIDNDGKSEVIFIAENGVLSALDISNNYSSWNTERGNLHRTGDTMTKIDLPTYTMALTENIDYGNRLDPYDDKFRVNAHFNLSYPYETNQFDAYITNSWLKIDTNHNNNVDDELVLFKNDLIQLGIGTYEGKIVDRTYRVESIFGNIIKGEYIVTYYDRGLMKLFDNIMAYTSAPTRNIQIKNGIWITLDIPSKIGDREYVIQGLGNRIRIYSPKSPAIFFEKEVKESKIYGTISSISKDKYVVITSYGAYLSPNPEAG
ncbi:MAG TPA: hypothetical protein PLU96_02070 [Methanofastidiosum sp.]|nr:hypothetical protein [Methanofastidiosum sp.]